MARIGRVKWNNEQNNQQKQNKLDTIQRPPSIYGASGSSSAEDVYGLGSERQTAPLRSIVARLKWYGTDPRVQHATCILGSGASVNCSPCTCISRARRLRLAHCHRRRVCRFALHPPTSRVLTRYSHEPALVVFIALDDSDPSAPSKETAPVRSVIAVDNSHRAVLE